MNPTAYTRREFLGTSLLLASSAAAMPYFLNRTAWGLQQQLTPGLTSVPGVPQDRVLVVVQMGGGNDGLNTVIPFGDALYYKARTGIAIPESKVLKIDQRQGVGLHPALAPLADLHHDGLLSIVQGTGYPNPNRSHFASMDIWHTADTSGTGDGWLGRYFDSECCGYGQGESGRAEKPGDKAPNPMMGIALGAQAPLAMKGRGVSGISFESPQLFQWTGKDVSRDLVRPYDRITREHAGGTAAPGSSAEFLTRTALDAQVASDTIRKAVATPPRATYPGGELSRQLQMVASMIAAGLPTRVYYVTLGGFDTHAGQGGENGRHAQLLAQLAGALKAFLADLKEQGNLARVLTLTFSEFGRRVGQNASGGTDHGTAAPVLLLGPMVQSGLVNNHPSLSDLDQGDLKFSTDFRSVYAAILDGWMRADSKTILGKTYTPIKVFKKSPR